jgi:hypothetical protein
MEQQDEIAVPYTVTANFGDQLRRIPLMHHHHVRAVQSSIQVKGGHAIEGAFEARVDMPKCLGGSRPFLGNQVSQAPAVVRLVDADLMAA